MRWGMAAPCALFHERWKGKSFCMCQRPGRGLNEAKASQPDVLQGDDPWKSELKAGAKPPTCQRWKKLYSLLFCCTQILVSTHNLLESHCTC